MSGFMEEKAFTVQKYILDQSLFLYQPDELILDKVDQLTEGGKYLGISRISSIKAFPYLVFESETLNKHTKGYSRNLFSE